MCVCVCFVGGFGCLCVSACALGIGSRVLCCCIRVLCVCGRLRSVVSGYCTKSIRVGKTFDPSLLPTFATDFDAVRLSAHYPTPPHPTLATKMQGRQLSASPAAGAAGDPSSALRASPLPSSLSLTISPRNPSLGMGGGGHPAGMHAGDAPEGF